MASTHTSSIESIRVDADILHGDIIRDANAIEKQSNRHHTTNARLSANRARKAIAAAFVDLENATRLLELARKEI